MDRIKIGNFIANLRKEKGLSQRELAEKLNISEATISQWEIGSDLPETELIIPLCEILQICANELLSGEKICNDKNTVISVNNRDRNKHTVKVLQGIGIFIFIASIVSLFLSLITIAAVGDVQFFGAPMMIKYMWIFDVFAIIPIASIILSFILKKFNLKYRKNLVVGFILTPIMLIYGSFSLIFKNTFSYDYRTNMIEISQKINFSFPEQGKIGLSKQDNYTWGYAKFKDKTEINSFVRSISINEFWLQKLKSDIINYLPFEIQLVCSNFDYYLFYNCEDSTYNQQPQSNGKAEYVFVCYDLNMNKLLILKDYFILIDN